MAYICCKSEHTGIINPELRSKHKPTTTSQAAINTLLTFETVVFSVCGFPEDIKIILAWFPLAFSCTGETSMTNRAISVTVIRELFYCQHTPDAKHPVAEIHLKRSQTYV